MRGFYDPIGVCPKVCVPFFCGPVAVERRNEKLPYIYIYIYIRDASVSVIPVCGSFRCRAIPVRVIPVLGSFRFIPFRVAVSGLPFRLPRFGFRINTWRFKSFGARPNRFRGGLNLPQQDQRCTPPQVASIFQAEGVILCQFIPVHSGSFRLFRFIPFRFMPLHSGLLPIPFRFIPVLCMSIHQSFVSFRFDAPIVSLRVVAFRVSFVTLSVHLMSGSADRFMSMPFRFKASLIYIYIYIYIYNHTHAGMLRKNTQVTTYNCF